MLRSPTGFSHRRSGVGHPLGPLRGSTVRDGGHDRLRRFIRGAQLLPVNFSYWVFGMILLLLGLTWCVRLAQSGRGDEQPAPSAPRAGSGMNSRSRNSAQVLVHRIFFTLMIVGCRRRFPPAMYHGLVAQGVPTGWPTVSAHPAPGVGRCSPPSWAYNPMQHLLGNAVLAHLPAGHSAVITGPKLLSPPSSRCRSGKGLHAAFDFAIVACLVAAGASWDAGREVRLRRAVSPPTVSTPRRPRAGPGDSVPVLEAESAR